MWNRLFFVFLLFFSALHFGCSGTSELPDDPAALFAEAQKYENDERYEEALRRYNDLKNRFPYSSYAVRAKLALADVYFKQESYAEAQLSYQTFREFHPRHPDTDYVIFQTGLSYFKQLPSSIDRDLTLAQDAIGSFEEIERLFPKSKHLKEARERREEALKMLADKEKDIADFYFIRKKWESALERYESLYDKFKDVAYESYALSRAAISAEKFGSPERADKYYNLLKNRFPQSPELEKAKEDLRK
jgi:outer membrane protein assembly factor BamD